MKDNFTDAAEQTKSQRPQKDADHWPRMANVSPLRLHVGICSHGGLHQARLSPDAADRRGLQSGREHRLQVPGWKHDEPGASAVLRQRVPGLQRSQVGSPPLHSPPTPFSQWQSPLHRRRSALTLLNMDEALRYVIRLQSDLGLWVIYIQVVGLCSALCILAALF